MFVYLFDFVVAVVVVVVSVFVFYLRIKRTKEPPTFTADTVNLHRSCTDSTESHGE